MLKLLIEFEISMSTYSQPPGLVNENDPHDLIFASMTLSFANRSWNIGRSPSFQVNRVVL